MDFNTSEDVAENTMRIQNLSEDIITTTLEPMEPSLLVTQPYLTGFLISLYVVIFLIGVFGNSMVLYVVLKYRTLQTITNKFIACLSLSDLLLCLFAIPFTPMNALHTTWVFGSIMCKLVPMVLALSVFVSTLTSVVIAIDRYIVIVHPHFPRMTHKTQLIMIIGIWIISISSSVPIAVFTAHIDGQDGIKMCREDWPNALSSKIYTWFILSIQLIIPAITITLCYVAVSYRLYKRSEVRLGSRVEAKLRMEAKRNRRINRMLIAMVVIFIICWLPLDLFHFFSKVLPKKYMLPVFLIAHIIAMSSVMYNPFLYGWMNENFNLHFRKALPFLDTMTKRKKKKPEENSRLTKDTTYHREQSSDMSLKNAENSFNYHYINNNGNAQQDAKSETEEKLPFLNDNGVEHPPSQENNDQTTRFT